MSRILLLLFFTGLLFPTFAQQPAFPIKLNQKWGLMDAAGQVVVEPLYDAIGEFREYGYAVMQRQGRVGLINRLGKELVAPRRSEEHTSELQSPVPISYAVFCLKKKKTKQNKGC